MGSAKRRRLPAGAAELRNRIDEWRRMRDKRGCSHRRLGGRLASVAVLGSGGQHATQLDGRQLGRFWKPESGKITVWRGKDRLVWSKP